MRRPHLPGDFCDFLAKNSLFKAIWITFWIFLGPFEKTKLLTSEIIRKSKIRSLFRPPPLTYRSSAKHG